MKNEIRKQNENQDKGGYFDLAPTDLGENARRDMTLALEDMGFEIEASHHEVAEGQNEIDFKIRFLILRFDFLFIFKNLHSFDIIKYILYIFICQHKSEKLFLFSIFVF